MSATGVEPHAATGGPRRHLLVTLLAVSAALNLFFVAGALWTRLHPPAPWPGPQQRYERVAAALDLSPPQRVAFDRYVTAMRASAEAMHAQIRPLIGSTWDELAKPEADAAQITRRFDEASAKWRQFQHESTARTLAFLATLSPAQRAKFVTIVRERRAPWLHRHAAQR